MSSTSTRTPYGMTYTSASQFGGAAPPMFDGYFANASGFVSNLSTIKAAGARAAMRVVGGAALYSDANSAFSLAMWKARMDLAAANAPSAVQMTNFVLDGTLIANYLIDDFKTGSSVFPGGTPTFTDIEAMAQYSKSYWSQVPTVVRADNQYMKQLAAGSSYTYLDMGWATWHKKWGPAQAWFQNHVNDGRAVKLGAMVGFNLLDGGSGITAPWNIHPNSSSAFGMSPQEIEAVGAAFSALTYTYGIMGWAYENSNGDSSYYRTYSGIQTALQTSIVNRAIGRRAGPVNWQVGSAGGSTGTVASQWGLTDSGNHIRTTGASFTLPMPANFAAGDLLGILAYSRDTALTWDKPSAWSEANRISGNSAQGGELVLFYRLSDGLEASLVMTLTGTGGTPNSVMAQVFCFSGGTQTKAGIVANTASAKSWPTSTSWGPVPGITSAISDSLVVCCVGRANDFNNGDPADPATMSATTTKAGESWGRAFLVTNTSGSDSGMFLDYTPTTALQSIDTKSWSQISGTSQSGAGCGFMVAFSPVSIQGGTPPAITPLEDLTISLTSTLSLTPSSTGSTPITWSLNTAPSNATLTAATGHIIWSPLTSGMFLFTEVATNSHGSDVEDFTVTVSAPVGGGGTSNTPPSITNPGNKTVAAHDLLSFLVPVVDVDGDPVTLSLDAGSPAGTFLDQQTGQFVWIPTGAQGPGTYPIVIVASDGQAESRSTFTVTVNDTPWTRDGGPSNQLGRSGPDNQFRRF